MKRLCFIPILAFLVTACTSSKKQVDRALSDLKNSDGSKSIIVVSDPKPDVDHYILLSWQPTGSIEFQFPIRYAYSEDTDAPLVYDLDVDEIPVEGVTYYAGALTTDELARLKTFLSKEKIPYSEGNRGGRTANSNRPLAYMNEITGTFDPKAVSAQEFVDSIFTRVYLCDDAPNQYAIVTRVEQAGADQPATKAADKPSVRDQPSPPTPKVVPR